VEGSKEEALKQVAKEELLKSEQTRAEYKKQQLQARQDCWQGKAMHEQYLKDIRGKVDEEKTWKWLITNGELKKETEGLILAAQDQALRTKAVCAKIDKTSTDSKYRLCKEKDETVDHLVSCCSKIAQTDYKERHNKVATMLHWNICKKYGFATCNNVTGGSIKSKKS